MCAKLSFDSSKHKPQAPIDPVPKDWYTVQIVESDAAPTKSDPKGGTRLALTVEILEGEYKGRKAWDGINTKNKNPKAQQIGEEQLSAICHATRVYKFTDTNELHHKPFEIKLGLEPERTDKDTGETYDARNVFKGFRPIGGDAPGGAASAPGATPGNAAPKWAGKAAGAGAAPAGKAAPKPPGNPAPTPPPESERPVGGEFAERPFWVFLEGDSVEKSGAEIEIMLGQGLPADTQVMAQDEEEWKDAAAYDLIAFVAPEEKAAPTPPPDKKVPAAPSAPGGKVPWKKR